MVMPKQKEMEVPLLEVVVELGGEARPQDVYPLMTEKFSQLTEEDIDEKLSSGGNKWTNRIQWVRQRLKDKGHLESPKYGVWAITKEGKKRVEKKNFKEPKNTVVNLVELYDDYEEDFQNQVLESLHELTPRQFEFFSKKLLESYGFIKVNVTKVGPDGGIDGYGRLKVGLSSMNVAFQCKRWQSNVGSKEIQQFRGAIQGKYEQGIFFTTSDFTSTAKDLSFQRGAVPVVLLNGDKIVELMVQKGLGIERKPLYLYYNNVDDFLNEG